MNNSTSKNTGTFRRAMLRLGGHYIDMYRETNTDQDYMGLPSIRIAMYPKHTKRLHLFDVPERFDIGGALSTCEKFGIVLTAE